MLKLRMVAFLLLATAGALQAGSGMKSAQFQEQLELHLVLAFDASASINDSEFALQRAGAAYAFRHPSVKAAISNAQGGVAIAVVQWSSIRLQVLAVDWVLLNSSDDAVEFADRMQTMPRILSGGGTMVHAGLDFSAQQFETAPGVARRRVIDVSGNGQSDDFDQMLATRDRLVRRGIVINGLAIEEDYDNLSDYFSRSVIGGAGAFVVTAKDHEDFGTAMKIKLLREINGALFAERNEQ